MEVVYVYQRKRKNFGRQAYFKDRPAELDVDLPSDPDYMMNYVMKNPCHSEVQCAPDMSEHEVSSHYHWLPEFLTMDPQLLPLLLSLLLTLLLLLQLLLLPNSTTINSLSSFLTL